MKYFIVNMAVKIRLLLAQDLVLMKRKLLKTTMPTILWMLTI